MRNSIWATIAFGVLLGAALFWLPFFTLKLLLFFLILGFFFRVIGRRRHYGPYRWMHADKIRNMSDEEYAEFKEKFKGACGHHGWHKGETKTAES